MTPDLPSDNWSTWGQRLLRQTLGLLWAPAPVRPHATDQTRRARAHVALVGAGPGARDLLTLRALERIQDADVILYDRLVDPEVIALAPANCKRIYVGKEVGAHAWPQPKIDACIVAEALKGQRVVRPRRPWQAGCARESIPVEGRQGERAEA